MSRTTAREKILRSMLFDAVVNGTSGLLSRACEGHELWQCDDHCVYLAIDVEVTRRMFGMRKREGK